MTNKRNRAQWSDPHMPNVVEVKIRNDAGAYKGTWRSLNRVAGGRIVAGNRSFAPEEIDQIRIRGPRAADAARFLAGLDVFGQDK